MEFRKATIHDMDELIHLRKKQLADEGIEPNIDIDRELYAFFENKLNDGSLRQWLVEVDGGVIACGAVLFYEFPPTYTNRSGIKAYITNMYTEENYRGQGIATSLLTKLVDEAKDSGVTRIWLGASRLGKPVYKKFGFKETDDWLELNF